MPIVLNAYCIRPTGRDAGLGIAPASRKMSKTGEPNTGLQLTSFRCPEKLVDTQRFFSGADVARPSAVCDPFRIGETRDTTSSKFQHRRTKRVRDVKLLEDHPDALFAIDRRPKYLLHDLTKIGGQKPLAVGYP